jgi:hypothetical protein
MQKCLPKHFGARNELIACTWLLQQGYEVFRNISQHGEVDIIAMREGETLYLDVKSSQTGTANRLRASQIAAGVKRLNVSTDGQCTIADDAVSLEQLLTPKHCLHCGALFKPSKERNVYCNKKCRMLAWDIKTYGDRPKRHYNTRNR